MAAVTGYADWLIDESYAQVGDLAETIALMLPPGDGSLGRGCSLREWMEQRLPALRPLDSAARVAQSAGWWRGLEPAASVSCSTS